MAADVVNFANLAVVDDKVDCLAVVFHIQPVTHIDALAVNRQWLVIECICNHQRNKLFREVVWTVVVGTTGDCHRQAVCTVVCHNQQVCSSLG